MNTGGNAILYVPPFAGEMHCSRDFVARMARELAIRGQSVLMLDLFGTGDSGGDFEEARWEIWQSDLDAAVNWLGQNGQSHLTLWGVRLGAILALEAASRANMEVDRVVLWQPVIEGEPMLTQFLRMHLAAEDDPAGRLREALSDRNLRRALAYGDTVEVGGFSVSPALIRAMDRLHLQPLASNISAPIHWLEVLSDFGGESPAQSLKLIEEWRGMSKEVTLHQAILWPFWHFPHSVDHQLLLPALLPMFGVIES